MSSHLFIGLGGQGGRTLCELRRIVALKQEEFARTGAKIDYLYVDSSDDVWKHKTAWSVLGQDVRLEEGSWMQIQENGPGEIEDLAMRANVSSWIGNLTTMRGLVGGESGRNPGANQRRRFGRLLFSQHAQSFMQAVQGKVGRLMDGGDKECTLHVFATLAGGTGSGGIVDVVSLLRTRYSEAAKFLIFGYVYATSDDGTKADVGYFYPNQYAALRDLNALMAGPYRPHNVTAVESGLKYDAKTPINCLFVTSNLTTSNKVVNLDRQIKTVADWCFQRVYAVEAGLLSPDAKRSLTFEDVIEAYPGEPMPNPERSYRFGALGIRRWAVPEDELQDKMHIEHAICAIRQMLFNHWNDNEGYSGVARVTTAEERASLAEQCRGQSGLTREELILDRAEPEPDIASSWAQHLNALYTRFSKRLPGHDEEAALEHFEREVEAIWASGFRQSGVTSFFTRMAAGTADRARGIQTRLAEKLNQEWMSGNMGLQDVLEVIQKVRADLDALRVELQTPSLPERDRDMLHRRVTARRSEWGKLTPLSSPFRRADMLRAHREDLKRLYVGRTRDKAAEYGRNLLGVFAGQLAGIESHYQGLREELSKHLNELTTQSASLCTAAPPDMLADSVIRELDLPALKAVLDYTRCDKNHQQGLATATRMAILAGGKRIDSRLNADDVRRAIMQVAGDKMKAGHNDAVTAGHAPVLGVSLLTRLQDRYRGATGELTRVFTEFVSGSVTNLRRNASHGPGELFNDPHVPFMPKRFLLVFLPERATQPFAQSVEQAIRGAIPAGGSTVVEVVDNGNPSELVIFVTDYWMALRFSVAAEDLRTKYTKLNNPQAKYFCNIDPDGELGRVPDYIPLDDTIIRKHAEAAIWIAREMKLVETDGSGRVHMTVKDSNGFPSAELLAESEASLSSLDSQRCQRLTAAVKAALGEAGAQQKAELLARVQACDAELLQRAGGAVTAPGYQDWAVRRTNIIALINGS